MRFWVADSSLVNAGFEIWVTVCVGLNTKHWVGRNRRFWVSSSSLVNAGFDLNNCPLIAILRCGIHSCLHGPKISSAALIDAEEVSGSAGGRGRALARPRKRLVVVDFGKVVNGPRWFRRVFGRGLGGSPIFGVFFEERGRQERCEGGGGCEHGEDDHHGQNSRNPETYQERRTHLNIPARITQCEEEEDEEKHSNYP